jgi:hypothetical protein
MLELSLDKALIAVQQRLVHCVGFQLGGLLLSCGRNGGGSDDGCRSNFRGLNELPACQQSSCHGELQSRVEVLGLNQCGVTGIVTG